MIQPNDNDWKYRTKNSVANPEPSAGMSVTVTVWPQPHCPTCRCGFAHYGPNYPYYTPYDPYFRPWNQPWAIHTTNR